MSMRSITRSTWTRVFVDDLEDLETADRVLAQRFGGGDGGRELRLDQRIVVAEGPVARVYEFVVVIGGGQIATIEPGSGIPLLQDVETQLQWDDGEDSGTERAWYAIAQAGFRAATGALSLLEGDINAVRAQMAQIEREASAKSSLGVSDLPLVSEMLVDIDNALSHVSLSITGHTQLARLLRRDVGRGAAVTRAQIDALVQQGEALTRRVEFLVDRQRFHSQGASQQISTSDLNIVKIFTVLWAILIPGTTLINWYGQNFEFMPELSWEFSSWVQILGVFFLAVLPIYTVKRAGQLR